MLRERKWIIFDDNIVYAIKSAEKIIQYCVSYEFLINCSSFVRHYTNDSEEDYDESESEFLHYSQKLFFI